MCNTDTLVESLMVAYNALAQEASVRTEGGGGSTQKVLYVTAASPFEAVIDMLQGRATIAPCTGCGGQQMTSSAEPPEAGAGFIELVATFAAHPN
jgi:hypothetical protein